MYRIVICEDSQKQRDIIKKFLVYIFEEISDQVTIIEFDSGESLLDEKLEGIDIFFLDIKMNKITGMEVAQKIREKNDTSEIIFITSLIEYVQEGYKVRAYRYLVKPIKYESLREHVQNCVSDIVKKRDNYMLLENRGSISKISISEITYIEVIKKDITVHTKKGTHKTKNSISVLEKELERYDFFRCHKSFLINMRHVEFIDKISVTINDEAIPVSKHRMSDLKTKLTHVLGDVLC